MGPHLGIVYLSPKRQILRKGNKMTKEQTLNRRHFVGAMGIGAGALLAGCSPQTPATDPDNASTDPVEETEAAWAPTATNPNIPALQSQEHEAIYTDEEVEHILNNPAVVTENFYNEDGSVVSPAYQMLRNHINRSGIGFGSMIHTDHQLDMWQYLFSQEEAELYVQMPLYTLFTSGEFAASINRDAKEVDVLCNAMAERGLLRRITRNGVVYFNTQGSEYGYYEPYVMHLNKEFLDLKAKNQSMDIAVSFLDSGTTMYRTLPVSLDTVIDGEYTQYDDWRDIFKRHEVFAVSPCVCRLKKIIDAGEADNTLEVMAEGFASKVEDHPMETCITTGEQAQYFLEIGAGRQITAEEGIAIVEDAIEKGMVVETVYTKAAENICLCHSDCCGNLNTVRLLNGGPALENYSNFNLMHQKDGCIKCGMCKIQCPMLAIDMDDEGYPIVDGTCVRCGQCARVCPQGVRGLQIKPEAERPYLPEDLLEDYKIKAKDRIKKGYLFDITSQSEAVAKTMEGIQNSPELQFLINSGMLG